MKSPRDAPAATAATPSPRAAAPAAAAPSPPLDGVWVASTLAALFPFWGLLGAHRVSTGTPPIPLTERFVAWLYRRAGGYGLAGLPVITTVTGYFYISAINEATTRARRRPP